MPVAPNSPTYFTNLVIENVRCFNGRHELKLVSADGRPARWTLIVGDNGAGKTTLLQCLARMRPVFNYPPDDDDDKGPRPKPVEPELAREPNNEILKALTRSGSTAQTYLRASLSVNSPLDQYDNPPSENISTEISITRTGDEITRFENKGEITGLSLADHLVEPLVVGYGAGRHPWVPNTSSLQPIDPIASLFGVAAGLRDAQELLHQLDYSSLKGDLTAKRRLSNLKGMLTDIVEDIHDPGSIEVLGPPPGPSDSVHHTGVSVKTPYGRVPLTHMSLGHWTVFAWTLDIAWWLLDRYPESTSPFEESAIVIVDEIDLHLHPRWQRTIRDRLTQHFPQVQFIATAHSPLMAQSSLDANLAVVQRSGDSAVILNDPVVVRTWRLDQLVTSDLFELGSARPPEIEQCQKRRAELMEKAELSSDERRELATLNRTILELQTESVEDERVMQIIREAAGRLPSGEDDS